MRARNNCWAMAESKKADDWMKYQRLRNEVAF